LGGRQGTRRQDGRQTARIITTAAQPTDAQKAPPSGMPGFSRVILTLGAMYVLVRIILLGYVQWFIDLYFKSHLSISQDAVFYIINLSWLVAFLLGSNNA
jgi:hypothetical protein